jgi:hypothetical protein
MHFSRVDHFGNLFRYPQMAIMDRIKGSAENTDERMLGTIHEPIKSDTWKRRNVV